MTPGSSGIQEVEIGDHGIGTGSTRAGASQVTFIFGGSAAATIGGSAFTSTDTPLVVHAQADCALNPIPFNVTAGNLRILQVF